MRPAPSRSPPATPPAISPANPGAAASALASASDASPLGPPGAGDGLLGSDPNDELSLGKKMYRANNFGMAETHFRRAVELHPRDAEAWLGLPPAR